MPSPRGDPGHHPHPLGRQHPQVRRPRDLPGGPGLVRHDDHAGRRLPRSVPSSPGLNVLVAGGTQAGKTTLLNCLASAVPANERVVSCEEVFELQDAGCPTVVAMQTRQANLEGTGEIRLRHLVKEALRMRPSRVIVGEVRAGGVPRPADRPELRTARHVHDPRQLRPRGHHQDVHLAVAGRREHRVPLRRPDRGRRGRHRRSHAAARLGASPGAGDRRRPRPGRGRRRRDRADLFGLRDDRLVRADGFPPHADQFERMGYDLARLLDPRGEAA